MSLLKIPILLSSVWLFNISFTCPNAPPNESERVYGAFYERICPALFPFLHRLSASIPCIAEAVVLAATRYPSSLSSQLLSQLVLSGQLPMPNVNRCLVSGAVIAAIGNLGRLWCFSAMGPHFTHQLAVLRDHRLVTTGPYALVRHPGYLFAALSALGMSLMIASPGSFTWQCGWLDTTLGKLVIGIWGMQNVLGWVLSYARCQAEDTLLRTRFREEWDAYASRVRYRMIPGLY